MSRDEYRDFCAARAEGRHVRRRPESIRAHDPVLASRLRQELEAEAVTNDQARAALARLR
jgi:hypothetical protein